MEEIGTTWKKGGGYGKLSLMITVQ